MVLIILVKHEIIFIIKGIFFFQKNGSGTSLHFIFLIDDNEVNHYMSMLHLKWQQSFPCIRVLFLSSLSFGLKAFVMA